MGRHPQQAEGLTCATELHQRFQGDRARHGGYKLVLLNEHTTYGTETLFPSVGTIKTLAHKTEKTHRGLFMGTMFIAAQWESTEMSAHSTMPK